MRFLDTNPAVLEWSSEELTIPYISPLDNCIHRYIPDFYMKTKEADSTITRTIIEIKPEKQTVQPKLQKKMTPRYLTEVKTWGVNSAKWAAAERYCDDLGWKFMKITEKELFRE